MILTGQTTYDEAKLEQGITFYTQFLMLSNFHLQIYSQKINN